MKEPTALLAAMDTAAIDLLNRSKVETSVAAEGEERRGPSIAESVKVFEAIGKYLEWRARNGPAPTPPKEPSPFDRLRAEFNGSDPSPERANRGTAARSARQRRAAARSDA